MVKFGEKVKYKEKDRNPTTYKAELREVAKKEGLEDTKIYEKFMMKRFPQEVHKSYMAEWASRFRKGNPTGYMDGESLRIYKSLL